MLDLRGFSFGDRTVVEFWQVLPAALALMFVFEGLLPFLSPARWRNVVATVAALDDASIRRFGFISMAMGVALLYLVN
jgi:uncharacterized protein YjeT (DUF2065 family)